MQRLHPGYLQAFNEAFDRYAQQADRPGYQPTFFGRIRHSKSKYPALLEMEHALLSSNIQDQKNIIIQSLLGSKLKANNYSFRTYLVEVLTEQFPDEAWEQFDNKKIVFFQQQNSGEAGPTYLYRGSLQDPDDAFLNGMTEGYQSGDIEDYADVSNYSTGVSTSKSARIASFYTSQIRTDHYGVHEFFGFLYQIHYRDSFGIDIDATQSARTSSYPVTGTKQEVNIIKGIKTEDIVGCGYLDEYGQYVQTRANPRYNPLRVAARVQDKKAMLKQIFTVEQQKASCALL
ncbi:hypothetical protein AQUSIP_23510 [Aquicella siphonis]|uniref:Pierisin-like domain-containing protein n=1 Tax=Aquicella siphonis TaxID=254247 RepID=A0A5E4PJ82_9COXI|nr:hypothetical protein [Aquicella siphonis]VVC77024.1 hypothetical protein AQUSIP_23510 [Aquicella siphonis]